VLHAPVSTDVYEVADVDALETCSHVCVSEFRQQKETDPAEESLAAQKRWGYAVMLTRETCKNSKSVHLSGLVM